MKRFYIETSFKNCCSLGVTFYINYWNICIQILFWTFIWRRGTKDDLEVIDEISKILNDNLFCKRKYEVKFNENKTL